jgi:hypothetical protein
MSMIEQKKTPPCEALSWIPRLKDLSIFIGWIGGLLLIGGLCWFLSAPLRAGRLLRSVNQVLIRSGDPRRLDEAIAPPELTPEALRIGTWYNMAFSGNGSRAVVFTLAAEGRFFPCMAVLNPEGGVEEIIPLSAGGEKSFGRLSPGSLQIYIRRIEGIKGGTP